MVHTKSGDYIHEHERALDVNFEEDSGIYKKEKNHHGLTLIKGTREGPRKG